MSVWTIIQARTGSTRLPKKVLADIHGKTMLERVTERAKQIGYPIVVAMPNDDAPGLSNEDALNRPTENPDVMVYFGSHRDVLQRYVRAAREVNADHVIRVTADCPLLDVEAARITVRHHLEQGNDMTHHVAEGRGVQVFRRAALEDAESQSRRTGSMYREHPDNWILMHSAEYKVEEMKFSVDTAAELERMRRWIGEQDG